MKATVTGLALIAAFAAHSARGETPEADPKKPAESSAASAAPAQANGLTIFIDPDTKRIRPPQPGEMERLLKAQARKPLAAPRVLTNVPPGGGVGLALDSSFDMFVVVTKKADGTLATSCVTGGDEADAAVASAAPAPAKPKEARDAR